MANDPKDIDITTRIGDHTPPLATLSTPNKETPKSQENLVMASSFLGSAVEYYDFLLYASAAGLVFPHVFFDPGINPTINLLMSYAILFTGYLARPLGGLLFGHFGDKFGRKNVLLITMVVMGIVSIGIGLMPTYSQIGVVAPLSLVGLRFIQGVAVGGEWAGAMLMSAEHASEKKKGFAASVAVSGAPAGAVLSTLVLGLFAGLSEEQFMLWGWRIPFLLSAIMVGLAIYMRYNIHESPDFENARKEGDVHTGVPVIRLFQKYKMEVVLGIVLGIAPLFMQAYMAVVAVPYVVEQGVVGRQTALMMLTASAFVHIFAIPFFAWLSDKWGRKTVMLLGAVISIVMVFPMFWLYNSTSPALVALGFMVGNPLIQASMYGPVGIFLAEKFSTADRYTGVSVTYQGASVLGAGLAPLAATWLMGLGNGLGETNVAIYFIVMVVISSIGVIASKETAKKKLAKKATAA